MSLGGVILEDLSYRININFSPTEEKQLREYCKKNHVTMSRFIREATMEKLLDSVVFQSEDLFRQALDLGNFSEDEKQQALKALEIFKK